ncbi:hypothetical protein B566_EDAN012090 [Ephemera danica]|nr:hypothetical protein B566_EDAN012090 [Ephemera danica]
MWCSLPGSSNVRGGSALFALDRSLSPRVSSGLCILKIVGVALVGGNSVVDSSVTIGVLVSDVGISVVSEVISDSVLSWSDVVVVPSCTCSVVSVVPLVSVINVVPLVSVVNVVPSCSLVSVVSVVPSSISVVSVENEVSVDVVASSSVRVEVCSSGAAVVLRCHRVTIAPGNDILSRSSLICTSAATTIISTCSVTGGVSVVCVAATGFTCNCRGIGTCTGPSVVDGRLINLSLLAYIAFNLCSRNPN